MSLVVVFLLCTGAAHADWPQFRGQNSSGVATGDAPPVEFGPGTTLTSPANRVIHIENIKPDKILELENLANQKNQLEIEKKEIEQRYNSLQQENQSLKQKYDDFKKKEIEEKKKKDQF